MISDSKGPVERLNSRSSLGCTSTAFTFEIVCFLGLGNFSFPRCSEKSNSRSIEDSSSASLAEDIVVQAVAELPLLSEELDERPSSPRDKDESTCGQRDGSIKLHFRLVPFGLDIKGIDELGEVRRKIVSARVSAPPTPNCIELPKILNAFEE